MINFRGNLDNKIHGNGMHSIFNAPTKNITSKDFNENRQVKNVLAVKEKVLASNFIENKEPEIASNSYIPSNVCVPSELQNTNCNKALSNSYQGEDKKVSNFHSVQEKIKKQWDKPVVKLTTSFVLGLGGILLASNILTRALAQKIGSKAKNFSELKNLLDKQISQNLDDVAVNLENIAGKLVKTANQDLGGDTFKYQQLIEFSQKFKDAASKTKGGNLPENIELLFASLKSHLNNSYSAEELAKLSPQLKKVADQFKNSQQLPPFARNININDDVSATIVNAIQDPTNVKNVQAVLAVLGITTVGAVGKRFADGLCDIWVRQKESYIQRDLQEAMIAVETKAFSGKNHILRNMLAENAKNLKEMVDSDEQKNYKLLKSFVDEHNSAKTTSVSFAGSNVFAGFDSSIKGCESNNIDKPKDKTNKDKKVLGAMLTIGGLLAALVLYAVLKNAGKTAKVADKLKKEVVQRVKFMPDELKEVIKMDTPFSLQDAVFGNPTKIGIASYVEGVTGFLYTYIMNKTPETFLAFMAIVGTTVGGYVGAKLLDSVKDVQVKRVNAETERKLQERLVQVELKNFIAKKNSLINPLVTEYKGMVKNNAPGNELNKQYNMILDEIKNGPPFIYA